MYGVDQCRICGTPIRPHGRRAREWQEAANLKPPLPEAEWRRRGYLCAPTWRQISKHHSEGCCLACGHLEMQRYSKPVNRIARMFVMTVSVLAIVFVVYLYVHH